MPDLDQPPSLSSMNQGMILSDIEINDTISLLLPPSSFQTPPGPSQSYIIGGVEVVPPDLYCLEAKEERIKGTVMDAYSVLVPDEYGSLSKAGCVIISSLVPYFMHGLTSLGTTLKNIVSQITKKKLLASRLWAFPLSEGSPLHWVLGWVDWSTHKMGLFDSLGRAPNWAKQNLQDAAAGLEHWLKYGTYPELKSLKGRFKDWNISYHTPTKNHNQIDNWSCGLFVMMAMPGLLDLNFSCAKRSDLGLTKSSALKAIKKVKSV
ncbi:hypothetical protein BD769DRAFT_1384274 [Suillus cothurnatus]|nr:hypothetical protein BD769DRAFT_1384274 [Suillus cothurnatus]